MFYKFLEKSYMTHEHDLFVTVLTLGMNQPTEIADWPEMPVGLQLNLKRFFGILGAACEDNIPATKGTNATRNRIQKKIKY